MAHRLKLNLEYELLDHYAPDHPIAQIEQWATFRLEILDENRPYVRTIFEPEWDILVFLVWFIENESSILTEKIPLSLENSSIAKGVYDFYDKLEPNPDDGAQSKLLDSIYQYRTRHGLRFAMRGTDIDNIYIGLLNEKITISFYDENSNWNYEVETTEFFNQVRNAHQTLRK